MALMLTLGVAGVYAQQIPVMMTFSGTAAPSAIDLKHPNTSTSEENLAGNGTLGPFTFRTSGEPALRSRPPLARPQITLYSGRRGRVSLPGRKSVDGQSHAGRRLHRVHVYRSGGPLYQDVPNHRWNRPFQEGDRRQNCFDRDGPGGLVRRLHQPRLLCRYGADDRNDHRSGHGSRLSRPAALGKCKCACPALCTLNCNESNRRIRLTAYVMVPGAGALSRSWIGSNDKTSDPLRLRRERLAPVRLVGRQDAHLDVTSPSRTLTGPVVSNPAF